MSLFCTLKNLHLSFGGKSIFNGANFSISKGDRIGLLGLNGKGKSSLLKVLIGELSADNTTPPFQFDKARGDGDPDKAYSSFLVPQELPVDENGDPSIKDYIYEFYPVLKETHFALEELNKKLESASDDEMEKLIDNQKIYLEKLDEINAWDLIQNYESYLKYFALSDLDAKVSSLSGGEQKKVLLSLGFSATANIVLWDEPTNHLDLETIQLFEERLSSSKSTFVLISHDRYLLGRATDKILHINNGLIDSFKGNYIQYLVHLGEQENSRIRLLNKLQNSLKRETDWMRQGIKARGTRSKKRVEGFHNLRDQVAKVKGDAKRKLEMSLNKTGKKTKSYITFSDVDFSFNESDFLFKNINLQISKGDKIGLIGANGVGKTTLINLIANKLVPTHGNIKRADNLSIQHFTQKREELDLEKTPFELLADGVDHVTLPNGQTKHIASYFQSFLFHKDQLHRPLRTFSGGEKNRLQMALNLLRAGDLWIFDEPTNDLDLETLQVLEEKLIEFTGSIILISHDRSFLSNITNKVWVLRNKSMENFEGGFEQAEEYLEALTVEDILDHDLNADSACATAIMPEKNSAKKDLSNKDKTRRKKLPRIIQELEIKIDKFANELEQFDFAKMNQELSTRYAEIKKQKESLEEELLKTYEELEELNAIS